VTAFITVSCERDVPDGRCPTQIVVFDAESVHDAREEAAKFGWYVRAHRKATGDFCPRHNGHSDSGPHIVRYTP
jgi:hypothetical protein